jgi:hypothetical protein
MSWEVLAILHYDTSLTKFEQLLVEIMIDDDCAMSEALDSAFSSHGVNTDNVFDLVDFLESQLYDLDKVQTMMMVYTGKIPDFYLTRIIDNEKEIYPKRSDES